MGREGGFFIREVENVYIPWEKLGRKPGKKVISVSEKGLASMGGTVIGQEG